MFTKNSFDCSFITFKVMLMNKEWTESKESKVELKESPACSKIFGNFLRYIYLGQIHINHLVVLPILALADKYNVKVSLLILFYVQLTIKIF